MFACGGYKCGEAELFDRDELVHAVAHVSNRVNSRRALSRTT
jgi:hypothetical protein